MMVSNCGLLSPLRDALPHSDHERAPVTAVFCPRECETGPLRCQCRVLWASAKKQRRVCCLQGGYWRRWQGRVGDGSGGRRCLTRERGFHPSEALVCVIVYLIGKLEQHYTELVTYTVVQTPLVQHLCCFALQASASSLSTSPQHSTQDYNLYARKPSDSTHLSLFLLSSFLPHLAPSNTVPLAPHARQARPARPPHRALGPRRHRRHRMVPADSRDAGRSRADPGLVRAGPHRSCK